MNQFYRRFLQVVLLFLTSNWYVSIAQVIELGTGSSYFPSNLYGPAYTVPTTNAGSRYAYIFPQSTISTLMHGDTIKSLDFLRKEGDSLTGTCNLKIFIRLGLNSNYGTGSINWVNQTGATGMKKVYDKNPKDDFGKTNGWIRLNFTNAYVADTTFGKHLEILIEFTQNNSQSSAITWAIETRFTVPGYGSNQCKYTNTNGSTALSDIASNSTDVHPSIKINFPRYQQDAKVKKVYALGKLPVPLGNPDTVKAIIKNVGKQKFNNQKLYIVSKGKNQLVDSMNVTLDYLEERLVNLPNLSPSNLGLDTLIVKIANDEDSVNNQAETYRQVTENIYSYKDPTTPIIGGIGFNGTTGDFVAKFYSNTAKAINQINVSLTTPSQKFRLGIWKADGSGGTPLTNIWTSDTLTSSPNFTTPVLPPVSVNGPFYVGVRQITNTNIGFGYQEEEPVRPKTFYYTEPYGGSNWIDFSPDAPYKFAIEPRLQADNDISAFSFDYPKDTLNLVTVKTMAPKATILNYGAKDQLTPFNVTLNIRRYGTLVYSSTKQDTLSSLRKHQITFDSTFLPIQAGDYDVTLITRLGIDQMKDNDTLKDVIVVANYRDVGIGSLFDPDIYTDYEQFIDSVYPIANIQNFGLDRIFPFSVTSQIFDSTNQVLYTDTQLVDTLESGSSLLVIFNTYPCSVRGKLKFRIITKLPNDTRKKNDTVVVFFNVIRSNDVIVTKGIYPKANTAISPPAAPTFVNVELENLGDLEQADPFPVICKIYYKDTLVYSDSVSATAYKGITTNLFFKKFQPFNSGYYKLICYSDLEYDQVRGNDTLKMDFAYGLPDDVEPFNPLPVPGASLEMGKVYAPKVSIRNNGFNSQKTPFSVLFQVRKGNTVIYNSIKSLTIDSGKTKTMTFDSTLFLNDTGRFDFVVYTMLGKDFEKLNDTLRGIYNALKMYDVGVSSILYPLETDTLLQYSVNGNPVAIIENLGDSLVKSRFRTTFRIVNSTTKALLYSQFIDTSFSTNAPLTIQFPKVANISSSQNVSVIANTGLINDQFRKNDSAFAESQVELWYDAVAQSIALPVHKGTYKTNSTAIKPVISFKNGGKKVIDQSKLVFTINKVDTVSSLESLVYKDSADVLNVDSNLTKTITISTDFDFTKQLPGLYHCYLDAFYIADQDNSNNQLTSEFRILDALGLNIVEFNAVAVYPNPATHSLMVTLPENMETGLVLRIFDMNGRQVLENRLTDRQSIVSIDHLSNGVYFIEINGQRIKLVIEH